MRRKAERLRLLDGLEAPDHWAEIRLRQPRRSPRELGPAPLSFARRLSAALVALGISAAGTLVVIRAFDAGDADRSFAAPGAARIVFAAASDEGSDLFSMEANGTDVRPLADTPANEEEPAASVDGTMLAFALREPGDPASYFIVVSDATGAGRREIPGTRLEDGNPVGSPAWSPDGSRIAFAAYGDGGGIYVADIDGGSPRRLTSAGPPTIHVDSEPAWSPDGGSIAFIRWVIGDADEPPAYEILEVGIEGGEPTSIARFPAPTQGNASDNGAIDGLGWSPDGSRLAFAWYGAIHAVDVRSGESGELVSCEELGCDERTDVFTDDTSWSMDGRRIAFTVWANIPEARADAPTIYVADLDGDSVTVASTGVGGLSPTWQSVAKGSTPSPTTVPDGSISANGAALPEGKLLVQIDEGRVEILGEGAETSTVVGRDLFALDLSPDGSRVLVSKPWPSGGPETDLVALDLMTGERTVIAEVEGWSLPALWSPDGSRVAYRMGDGNTLCVRDLAIAEPRCLPEIGKVYAFDWSPDSRRLVLDQPPPGSLTVLDVETEQTSVVANWDDPGVLDVVAAAGLGEPVAIQFQGPQWSPSGWHLAALAMVRTEQGHSGNVVLVFDLRGDVVAHGVPFGEFSEARRWSPAADVFAYASGDPPYQIVDARLLDAATGEDRLLASTSNLELQTIQSLAWSPSGRWVAVATVEPDDHGWFASEIRILDTRGVDPPRTFRSDGLPELVDWGP